MECIIIIIIVANWFAVWATWAIPEQKEFGAVQQQRQQVAACNCKKKFNSIVFDIVSIITVVGISLSVCHTV